MSNDCVSIPNFGGMVAQQFRAEINPGTHIMRPPGKRISFHEKLDANVHMLVAAVAAENRVTPDKAREMIANEVSSWKSALSDGHSVKLPKVGRFYLDKEGAICFNQSLESNFDLTSFGLDMFRASAIKRDAEIKEAVSEAIAENSKGKVHFPFWRAAAVFAGIGALLTVGFLKSDVELPNNMLADFNPFHLENSAETAAQKVEKATEKPEAFLGEMVTVQYNDAVKSIETSTANSVNQSQPFHVVVGSFTEKKNANDLVSDLSAKGYSPIILPFDGKYSKVSIQGFAKRNEAVKAMRNYKSALNKGAWVFYQK